MRKMIVFAVLLLALTINLAGCEPTPGRDWLSVPLSQLSDAELQYRVDTYYRVVGNIEASGLVCIYQNELILRELRKR